MRKVEVREVGQIIGGKVGVWKYGKWQVIIGNETWEVGEVAKVIESKVK